MTLPQDNPGSQHVQEISLSQEQLRILDGEFASLMETDSQGDLFIQSRQAQQMLEHAVALAKVVDQTHTPAAAMVYLEAARSGMRWVDAPEPDRKADAGSKLEQARSARKVLEANQWIRSH